MDDDWDRVLIIPFINLSEEGNQYVILVEAPGLCASNLELQLQGRELAISSHAFTATVHVSGAMVQTSFVEHRIRLPGPVEETGPPKLEPVSDGRVRVTMHKAIIR